MTSDPKSVPSETCPVCGKQCEFETEQQRQEFLFHVALGDVYCDEINPDLN